MDSPSPPRSPWQLLYAAAHRLRRAWWARRAESLPRPVVSVGNLHWGGGGKTPLVGAIAARLRDRGLAVAILSRGYGRRDGGVRIVSVGEGPLLGPLVAGDEPVLLAGELPGVAVVVGARRAEAGRQALERLDPPPDLFLLDDGFSHLALRRDVDLLAFPAADPFAGGRLPPSGRLREPLSAARRADAAILTGAPGPAGGGELAAALAPHGFTGPGFASRTLPEPVRTPRGEPPGAGERVLLVAAVARPAAFAAAARESGLEVAGELFLPDHHAYPQKTLEAIERRRREVGARWVLTTAKDRVKLFGRLASPLAELPVRAEPEEAFWSWLDERLAPLLGERAVAGDGGSDR